MSYTLNASYEMKKIQIQLLCTSFIVKSSQLLQYRGVMFEAMWSPASHFHTTIFWNVLPDRFQRFGEFAASVFRVKLWHTSAIVFEKKVIHVHENLIPLELFLEFLHAGRTCNVPRDKAYSVYWWKYSPSQTFLLLINAFGLYFHRNCEINIMFILEPSWSYSMYKNNAWFSVKMELVARSGNWVERKFRKSVHRYYFRNKVLT